MCGTLEARRERCCMGWIGTIRSAICTCLKLSSRQEPKSIHLHGPFHCSFASTAGTAVSTSVTNTLQNILTFEIETEQIVAFLSLVVHCDNICFCPLQLCSAALRFLPQYSIPPSTHTVINTGALIDPVVQQPKKVSYTRKTNSC